MPLLDWALSRRSTLHPSTPNSSSRHGPRPRPFSRNLRPLSKHIECGRKISSSKNWRPTQSCSPIVRRTLPLGAVLSATQSGHPFGNSRRRVGKYDFTKVPRPASSRSMQADCPDMHREKDAPCASRCVPPCPASAPQCKVKPRRININDLMQQGYAYLLTEPVGHSLHPNSAPHSRLRIASVGILQVA